MEDSTAPKSMAIPLIAFSVGAVVALLIGVFGKVHDPTLSGTTTLGFRTVIQMKVVVATVVGVLALFQLIGALWMYGRLGIKAPTWLGTAHRITGVVALLLSLFVAYHCLWALGLESGHLKDGEPVSARTVVHWRPRLHRHRRTGGQTGRRPVQTRTGVVPAGCRWPAVHPPRRGHPDLCRLVCRRQGLAERGRVRLRTRRSSREPPCG